ALLAPVVPPSSIHERGITPVSVRDVKPSSAGRHAEPRSYANPGNADQTWGLTGWKPVLDSGGRQPPSRNRLGGHRSTDVVPTGRREDRIHNGKEAACV